MPMPRTLVALSAALALLACSRKDEVVVAAPAAAPAPAPAAAGPATAPAGELPPGHPPLGGQDGAAGGPGMDAGGAPAMGGGSPPPPHGAAMSAGGDVPVGKVARAAGPEGRTVAEVFAQRAALKGKVVAIHGTVVKYTPGVMGKNWIHLRDGTGTAGKDNDVTVTTQDTAARGEVVTVRGTVALDQDIGMGAPYPVIVQDAQVKR